MIGLLSVMGVTHGKAEKRAAFERVVHEVAAELCAPDVDAATREKVAQEVRTVVADVLDIGPDGELRVPEPQPGADDIGDPTNGSLGGYIALGCAGAGVLLVTIAVLVRSFWHKQDVPKAPASPAGGNDGSASELISIELEPADAPLLHVPLDTHVVQVAPERLEVPGGVAVASGSKLGDDSGSESGSESGSDSGSDSGDDVPLLPAHDGVPAPARPIDPAAAHASAPEKPAEPVVALAAPAPAPARTEIPVAAPAPVAVVAVPAPVPVAVVVTPARVEQPAARPAEPAVQNPVAVPVPKAAVVLAPAKPADGWWARLRAPKRPKGTPPVAPAANTGVLPSAAAAAKPAAKPGARFANSVRGAMAGKKDGKGSSAV